MYQITGTTISFRVTDEEKEQLNAIALQLQTDENQVFTNGKQLVFAMYSHCLQLENKLNTLADSGNSSKVEEQKTVSTQIQEDADVSKVNTDLNTLESNLNADVSKVNTDLNTTESEIVNKLKSDLITLIGYEETPSDEQLYSDVIEVITTPNVPEKVTETKTVEVERKLGATEVLIKLSEAQFKLLTTIARWRSAKKLDEKTDSIGNLMLRLIFNKGVLYNWHDSFKTGLTESKKID